MSGVVFNPCLRAMQKIVIPNVSCLTLGCFLEAESITVRNIPIAVPAVLLPGIDPVWLGTFHGNMMELALILPPGSLNLSVVQSGCGELANVYRSIPDCVCYLLMMIALTTIRSHIVVILPEVLI